MECVSCGASVEITNELDKYVKCSYCDTSNANFKSFESISSIKDKYSEEDIDDELLDGIVYNLQHQDYKEVNNLALKYKNKKPNSWIALTYLALSEFWLGTNDFNHLKKVFLNLNKAQEISNNSELVLDAFEKIANNTAILASKNKCYGPELESSVTAIEIIKDKKILGEAGEDVIKNYLEDAVNFIKDEAKSDISKDTKNFDIKTSRINVLYRIVKITENKEQRILFYLLSLIHINKNKTKSYIKELEKKNEEIKIELEKESCPEIEGVPIKNLLKLLNAKESGCFIATAVLDPKDQSILNGLQLYRNEKLLTNSFGKILVQYYYLFSPNVAKIIKKNYYIKVFVKYLVVIPAFKWSVFSLNRKSK
jgi:hypothetical protein